MKKKKGFTLIELLAVVVVLGLTFMFVGAYENYASTSGSSSHNNLQLYITVYMWKSTA